MKIDCKLEQIIINMQEKVRNTTVLFKPVKEAYAKAVTLKISSPNIEQVLQNLELPNVIGDIISVDLATKNKQGKLPGKGENEPKTGRKNKTD